MPGFTLVEMLVAIAILALMAAFAWRGVAGIVRSRDLLAAHADGMEALNIALLQWGEDLDAVQETGLVPALSFDGRTLRLTRRDTTASVDAQAGIHEQAVIRVVAWTLRDGRWRRWASPGLNRADALTAAWELARRIADGHAAPGAGELALLPTASWKVAYFRQDHWSAPVAADGAGLPAAAHLPDGVRLELMLPAGGTPSGRVVRDWTRSFVAAAAP